jgi:hypothetical protein
MHRRAVILLAGLTSSGCGGSGDGYRPEFDLLRVTDGMVQVDPRFELESPPSRGTILLLRRYTPDFRAPDQRLDFAYLEMEPLARLTREESLHTLEEAFPARRVLPDVLLQ